MAGADPSATVSSVAYSVAGGVYACGVRIKRVSPLAMLNPLHIPSCASGYFGVVVKPRS